MARPKKGVMPPQFKANAAKKKAASGKKKKKGAKKGKPAFLKKKGK